MRSLTGFSIPHHLLSCRWRRSGHILGRRQWSGLLRPFQMIHVLVGFGIEPPPRGTLFGFDYDLGQNLAVDSTDIQVGVATSELSESPDILHGTGRRRMLMESHKSSYTGSRA